MLRKNNKRLYESIIRDVAKTVKKHLNESKVNNPNVFRNISMSTYRKWLNTSDDLVNQLKKQGELYQGMDFYEAAEIIEDDL